MTNGSGFCAVSMAKKSISCGLIVLLLLCDRTDVVQATSKKTGSPGFGRTFVSEAAACRSAAFLSSVPHFDASTSRSAPRHWARPVEPNKMNGAPGLLLMSMAKPGKSDEQIKQERDAEIRATISRLKSQGKMKNADGTKMSAMDSAMDEAEAFFNKPSPFKKYEARLAERKQREAEAEELKREEDGVE
eukprot:CAMPEP_0201607416 /NCGR_PEP_ID=MMETSP0492-20130828/6519_1 /ASSEMBLY_ACC=CAM_ASM_000837 /TAXON_ID=420259 /ORGANISM="Thalassiosira gravida, Strain GMp14c1" /LENGTH=188 /DNA_ID=CAMNT_0048071983 /DNA_START=6 /DNA_END=572 /DNA_ORIENTATION=-